MKKWMCIYSIFLLNKVIYGAPVQANANKNYDSDIVSYNFENLPDGGYRFSYETADGQTRNEYGYFKQVNNVPILTVEGSYSYFGDDGKLYQVNYKADENGYVASQGPSSIDFALPPNIAISLAGG